MHIVPDMHVSFNNEVSFFSLYILTCFELCYIFHLVYFYFYLFHFVLLLLLNIWSSLHDAMHLSSSILSSAIYFSLECVLCILFFIFSIFGHLCCFQIITIQHTKKTRVIKFKYMSPFGSLQTFSGKYTSW